jgi:PAS domain S-box-containing protein
MGSGKEVAVARRQIAPVALVLALTVAGFLVARALGQRQARRDSAHRGEVAAAQIRERVEQGSALTEGLRLLMVGVGGRGVTHAEFATQASRWLGPAGFPAAAWVEQVSAARRGAYERRIGHAIVSQERGGRTAPAGSRPSYLPATLVSGVAPMLVSGMDLAGESGVRVALARAGRLFDAAATPVGRRGEGTQGLLLIRFAPRLTGGVVKPGFVVVFVSDLALRAAATATPSLGLTVGGTSTGAAGGKAVVHTTFMAAGQRFDVGVPGIPVGGAAAVLPWIIVAAGLALAALASALGVHAARRARAQDELDRIFTLTPDLITVADFDGRFMRVNPAVAQVLGYTPEEFLARPYLDFVHPEDRERTAAEAAAISHGRLTLSFTNRFIAKDGSPRVLEWTAAPVVDDRIMYGVARDVTARRQAESELRRLADEQAALRRVATMVADESSPDDVFAKVAEEVGRLVTADAAAVWRYEPNGDGTVVGSWGDLRDTAPVGQRIKLDGESVTALVYRTQRPARFDAYDQSAGEVASYARQVGLRSAVGTPIFVGGRLWGSLGAASSRPDPIPADAEPGMRQFTELVATAISNVHARSEVQRLAEEQAALRRVATMIARESPPEEVFARVAEEVGLLLDADGAVIHRYEPDGEATVVVGSWGNALPVATYWKLDGYSVATLVHRTERSARVGDFETATGDIAADWQERGLRSGVGTPIVVNGRLWGAMAALTARPEPLPADAESRIAEFTELVATAISNVQARSDLAASRARVVAASDDTRRQVERDLHDGAQQRLVHTVLSLKLARDALQRDPESVPALLDDALDHAEETMLELRELVHGILPPILLQGGLRAAVRSLARRMPVPVETSVDEGRFPAAVEATAYFVVAEALTNVAKHSGATRASVAARVERGTLLLQVRDDGVGGAQTSGSGFTGLADRLAVFDGQLRVDSPAGGGTCVAATIPLPG